MGVIALLSLYVFIACWDREKFAINGLSGPAKQFTVVVDGSTQKVEPQFVSPQMSG
jgi:hypothetical protein